MKTLLSDEGKFEGSTGYCGLTFNLMRPLTTHFATQNKGKLQIFSAARSSLNAFLRYAVINFSSKNAVNIHQISGSKLFRTRTINILCEKSLLYLKNLTEKCLSFPMMIIFHFLYSNKASCCVQRCHEWRHTKC